MRKLLGSLVVVIVAMVLVPGTALATHSNGNGPAKDFNTGTLKLTLPTPLGSFPGQIHNNGSSTASSGTPATGSFWTDIFNTPFGTVTLSGDILCLKAVGNNAWLRTVIVNSNTPLAPPGFGLLSRITDNGPGNSGVRDAGVGFLTPPPGPAPTCPTTPFTTNTSTNGNMEVHDGV
jgi:hypothetical protein